MDSSSLKAVTDLGAVRVAAVQELFPSDILVIHRKKCKVLRGKRCTCTPAFIQPPARV